MEESVVEQLFVWEEINKTISILKVEEPILYDYILGFLILPGDFKSGLSSVLNYYLFSSVESEFNLFYEIIYKAIDSCPDICRSAIADLLAFCDRDPASLSMLQTFIFAKGYIAIQAYRVAHALWCSGNKYSAQMIQLKMSNIFSVDIHPAARLGKGLFFDHATGVVIGETAVVEDNVSILHEVTLGGTGKQKGARHPTIREGALLCSGAKILGNIEVGKGSKVGAGSVVLKDVPPSSTVVGIPAKVVGALKFNPAFEMDQHLI
ncbi:serine O-acetyltransferase [Pseudoalteromonas citrea]|uniref:Serine acetyltransferase n=2 Tax=Pseudoalteromonas citrea TaxID=43655 RepID=A0AAD4AGW3_9GAMM|nr:serine O-acetyltransferase [Pseudoalteromonas citrea]KAF7768880.1 serine O-acetyltransferase [Pseudoalteromonas citrea]